MSKAIEWSSALGDAVQSAEKSVLTVFSGRPDGATGIAWSSDLVVTAAHALDRSEAIELQVDGNRRAASLLGSDPASDLAVLRVEGAALPVPARADLGGLRVGELVVALSRPARGLRARLGIVSSLGGPFRLPGGQEVDRYVQSDIQPAHGHSGSVLIDASGALVGLNSAGISRGTLVALPPSAVENVVGAIVQHGRVRRARVGVGLERVELPRAVGEKRKQERALLVTSVLEGSPAERGGLLLGDVILGAAGRATARVDDLMSALGEKAIGTSLAIEVLRAGEERTLEILPEAR